MRIGSSILESQSGQINLLSSQPCSTHCFVSAYGAYVQLFSEEIAANGVAGTLEKYLFDKEVNASGANMLTRIFSGA